MKEQYYTKDTIGTKFRFFLEKIKLFRDKHKFQIDINNAALLLIDCQNFFDKSSHAFFKSNWQ
jgi:isochorismate hydrolase